jgi:GNAT superfamily N-acetyltransferase
MEIQKIIHNKKTYLDLLLLADEQEDMVDRYLGRGDMFILDDNGVKAECVVTKEGDQVYEIKNLAVRPDCQRKGYGRQLVEFVLSHYEDCGTLLVGTGETPSTLGFYHRCGFSESHRVRNFFTDYYDHLIFEDGRQLVDMVYLKREKGSEFMPSPADPKGRR